MGRGREVFQRVCYKKITTNAFWLKTLKDKNSIYGDRCLPYIMSFEESVNYSDMLETLNEYSTVIAEELFASGRRANPLLPLYHRIGCF